MNCKYNPEAVCRHNLSCIDGFLQKKDYVEKCNIYSIYQDNQTLKILLKNNGFPKSVFTYSISDYKGEDKNNNLSFVKEYISSFSEESDNLYFYGSSNTQKSTVAQILGREILRKGFNCKYILADDLVRLLTRTEREEDIREEVEKISITDYLIVDDFEKSKIVLYESGWQLKYIYSFLKKRIDLIQKPTLLISNSTIDELEKDFDYSTYSLIKREMKIVREFKDSYCYESSKSDFNFLK